jgi:GTP-binding protein HflX
MFDVREKPSMVERAFLIGVYYDRNEEAKRLAESLLEELAELVDTLGIEVVGSECVHVRKRNARFLTGTGKCEELIAQAKGEDYNADCIVFDNEMSPMQQRTWEEESDLSVIDREEVILDIFKERAHSREATLQVQLARMEYSLPRLARMWDHLDRQGGGSGGGKGGAAAARGEGEKQIEVDRRLARKRIDRMRAELENLRKQRQTQRKQRTADAIPHAAIVGYTNSGKSSLLNALSGSTILAEDKLFATLDPTTRRIDLPDGQPMLLTDTVGFVRNLPHRLIEAFKATLEEAVLADFLIHVLDATSPEVDQHYQTTVDVLRDLGATDKRTVVVLNKIDLLEGEKGEQRLHALRQEFGDRALFASVKNGIGLEGLIDALNDFLHDRVSRVELRVPQSRQDLIALIRREGKILAENYDGNDVLITAVIPNQHSHLFADFAVAKAEV